MKKRPHFQGGGYPCFPSNALLREALSPRRVALIALAMAITTFGLFNIHRRVDVTEGGVLGMVLLLDHHFGIPPWLLTAVLDAACYFLGWRALGTKFLIRSGVATLCGSAFFRLWEFTRPPFCPISAPAAPGGARGRVLCGRGRGPRRAAGRFFRRRRRPGAGHR